MVKAGVPVLDDLRVWRQRRSLDLKDLFAAMVVGNWSYGTVFFNSQCLVGLEDKFLIYDLQLSV